MENHKRFETGILKVITFIGLVRYIIAFIINDPLEDGYGDFYLDLSTAIVFALGLCLVFFKAHNKWIVGLFFVPLIGLLWISLYYHNGLVSASEINAFAIVIILSLTIQGRLPWAFIGVLLLGMVILLYFVEQQNLSSLNPADYSTSTHALLLVTLANIWITFHAKNVFNYSRRKLNLTNNKLLNRRDEIQEKREQLIVQNEQLTSLRADLEEKVLERTEKLLQQKDAIEKYQQLTLTELMKPYQKTIESINKLEGLPSNEMIEMLKISGKKLEGEVEKLKSRLTTNE